MEQPSKWKSCFWLLLLFFNIFFYYSTPDHKILHITLLNHNFTTRHLITCHFSNSPLAMWADSRAFNKHLRQLKTEAQLNLRAFVFFIFLMGTQKKQKKRSNY